MSTLADNTSMATVKVPSLEQARLAISLFHRRKIGYKRINIGLGEDRESSPAEGTRYLAGIIIFAFCFCPIQCVSVRAEIFMLAFLLDPI